MFLGQTDVKYEVSLLGNNVEALLHCKYREISSVASLQQQTTNPHTTYEAVLTNAKALITML